MVSAAEKDFPASDVTSIGFQQAYYPARAEEAEGYGAIKNSGFRQLQNIPRYMHMSRHLYRTNYYQVILWENIVSRENMKCRVYAVPAPRRKLQNNPQN